MLAEASKRGIKPNTREGEPNDIVWFEIRYQVSETAEGP